MFTRCEWQELDLPDGRLLPGLLNVSDAWRMLRHYGRYSVAPRHHSDVWQNS